MGKRVRTGKSFRYAQREEAVQERKPTGCSQGGRRSWMTAGVVMAVILLIGAMAAPLWAQSYPNRPIRLILPFPAGGVTDSLGRIIGQKLGEGLGQPVVPENRAGAGGNIGIEAAVKAKPDGYTLVLGGLAFTISPSIYKKLNYDPIKDLAPISIVAESQYVLIIRPAIPAKNLKELVAYAKANPGKLNFGSSGVGGPSHMAGEMLKSLANINIVHVPYKGTPQAMAGMMGGEIDMVVSGSTVVIPQIQAGKVRPLAVLSNERLPSLPDVPTAKEAGIDNWVVTLWHGLLAPAGTPREIINRLNAEWIKVSTSPDIKEKLQKADFDTLSNTPEQFSGFIKAEIARWGKVAKDAKIATID